MNSQSIIISGKKRSKRVFRVYDPILGDPYSSHRFHFKLTGIKKVFLPVSMRNLPLFKELVNHKSLSSFFRSPYFTNNFSSPALFHKHLHKLRLEYDFPYWLACNCNDVTDLTPFSVIIETLQNYYIPGNPLRLIIRRNNYLDPSLIYHLFFQWANFRINRSYNSICFLPSQKHTHFFRSRLKNLNIKCFMKKLAKCHVFSANNPNAARSLNFNYLLLSNMEAWPLVLDDNKPRHYEIFSAAFPVIAQNPDSIIILDSGNPKNKSLFISEWSYATETSSQFIPVIACNYLLKDYYLKFDFPDEKYKLYDLIQRYKNSNSFPNHPAISGRFLSRLWEIGLPLETINWFLAESSFFRSKKSFIRYFPLHENPNY